jgi:hypothetical protein
MTLQEAQSHARVSLAAAQAAFRASPSRATALAYMDAAIGEWERAATNDYAARVLLDACEAVRDWLMNEK